MIAVPFRRVLVGWDGSADAAEALNAAAAIAGREGGHVVALTVLRQDARLEAGDDDGGRPAIARLAEEHFEHLRRRPSAAPVLMSTQVLVDSRHSAGHAVCAYAAEYGFDLLVLGRRGENVARLSRLGRVADEAVRHSQVPVLLLSAP